MSGVRLVCTDPDLRGRLYLVEHPTRKYIVPKLCGECNVPHVKKTYHLKLDGEGGVIVSEQIFHRLREAGLPKLNVSNEVLNPPHQRVGIDAPTLKFGETPYIHEARGGVLSVLKNKLAISKRMPVERRNFG